MLTVFKKVVPRVVSPPNFDENASYLIIGGLGGLGRAMCQWMTSLKAKNIIVISRSGMKSQSAVSLGKELQQAGVRLTAYACDVSDADQLDQVLKLCAKEMPPIRGVIHSAMVLKVSVPAQRPHGSKDHTPPERASANKHRTP